MGTLGCDIKQTGLRVATWTLCGQVTWASRSSGPTCVQKGRPEISSTTDIRVRPKFGSLWMPVNWACTYPHKMAVQQWAPTMDARFGRPILGIDGRPIMGESGHQTLSTTGNQIRPSLESISIHVGHPTLSTMETHAHPYWMSTSAQIESPHISTTGNQIRPS